MAELHHRGVIAVLICSDQFLPMAQAQRIAARVPELPLVVIQHPLGGIGPDEVEQRIAQAWPQLCAIVREHTHV